MKQQLKVTILAALLLGAALPSAAEPAPDTNQIMECVRGNFPTAVSIRRVTFITTGPAGESSTLSGRVYATLEAQEEGNRLMRATLVIDGPPNMRGAAYLVRETDDFLRDGMFVYLPSVGRVRRITGNLSDNPLMGTEFSYFEFKQLANAFGDLQGDYQRKETVAGRPALVMEFKPLPGLDTRYTSVTAWVDQKTCLILGAEFFEADKIIKRLTAPASGISKSGEHLYLKEIRMSDLIDGSETVMFIDQVTINDEPSNVYFSPKTFYLIK